MHGKARPFGAKPLGDLVTASLDPLCRKRGLISAELLTAWPSIVGAQLAASAQPERLVWPRGERAAADAKLKRSRSRFESGATLVLRARGPAALIVSHDSARLIERINGFFGNRIVHRLRIVQFGGSDATGPHRAPPPSPQLSAFETATLEQCLEVVANDKLRASLRRLGVAVLSHEKTSGTRETG